MAECMFLFNTLNTQNVAYQQNKLYFRVAKIKAEIKNGLCRIGFPPAKIILYER